ncbi:CKLF-like MARVEL transmembrane domain-containing protein 7 isoform X1 [Brienomyrus brachyistius]|uniref:CKLF-like MARVEL transmembrane domain-containing protein 7 isoform X1 n=1 Tax=Brienomyrus brachyistius TaxID=42636 RepID=UPI0020B283FB|nr:CKLF-like MARVEL transmembrane domain-containing protein 7 isoform X1 [Brienomyrus brachyistius]
MSHTVIKTTTTTTTTSTYAGMNVNTGYTRSYRGMLEIGQVLSLLIAFLCVYCELRWYGPSGFLYFQVVTLWFHIAFLIFLIMHVFDLQTKMPCINWTITEFLHYVLGFFLVFIASIVVGVQSHGYSSFVAGSVFGFIAAFLLVLSLWLSYRVTFGRQQMTVGV